MTPLGRLAWPKMVPVRRRSGSRSRKSGEETLSTTAQFSIFALGLFTFVLQFDPLSLIRLPEGTHWGKMQFEYHALLKQTKGLDGKRVCGACNFYAWKAWKRSREEDAGVEWKGIPEATLHWMGD